jgi:nucleotide-binding universal stress UspA family protein
VRYAEGLASSFKGQVIEEVGRCEDDIARERGATLLVVALRTPVGLFGDTTERVLRTCTVPMLFIKS